MNNLESALFKPGTSETFFGWTEDVQYLAKAEAWWEALGAYVRHFQGWDLQTERDLFAQFTAGLQFPYYFGYNWNALHDSLQDWPWDSANYPSAIILVIYKADLVLAQVTNWDAAVDRDRTPIARLTRYFQDAAEELSVPVEGDQPYNHPALPFKVILHSTADGGLDDWATSGGHLTAVDAAEVIRDYGLDRWHVLVQGADPEPVAETVSEEFGDAVRVDVEDGTVFRCDGASVAVGPWRRRPGPRPGADYLASFTDPVVDVEISGEDGQTIFNRLLYVFDEHVRAMSADWRVGYY